MVELIDSVQKQRLPVTRAADGDLEVSSTLTSNIRGGLDNSATVVEHVIGCVPGTDDIVQRLSDRAA